MQESEAKETNSKVSTQQWGEALELPCHVNFGLRIPHFTVGDLLRLKKELVVDSRRAEGTDVEVELNGRLIGWAELEAVGERLAFRITELS